MPNAAKLVTLQLLGAYKWAISPMFPPACRYVPSCSEYAIEAVDRYGALRGSLMAIWRLLRCHPFAHGGFDPVVRGEKDNVLSGRRLPNQGPERARQTAARCRRGNRRRAWRASARNTCRSKIGKPFA